MQDSATECDPPKAAVIDNAAASLESRSKINHGAQFIPARDSRNRRVPGLYVRNGRYYCQLWVAADDGRKSPRRFPLLDDDHRPIRTLQQAKDALEIKRHERRDGALPTPGRKPLFGDYCGVYLEKAKVKRKRPSTLENERQSTNRWREHLGHIRIDRISPPLISAFVEKRLKGDTFGRRRLKGVSERTANLDLIVLRNVLKAAVDDGYLRHLPRIKALDEPPAPKRTLITPAEFERLITCAQTACEKNGQQLVDYLRFLAFSGAREQEALRVRWADVDFEREQVSIGADGLAKNWESRTVEFNSQLGGLLSDMRNRRAPDCAWLFPSPQRGSRDDHAKSFRESLKLSRKEAKLPWVGFHDLRHYFCSVCVMARIDFMTIATWLGHKDGGILVGKVYGHLLDAHKRDMAARLVFVPSIVPLPSTERVTQVGSGTGATG